MYLVLQAHGNAKIKLEDSSELTNLQRRYNGVFLRLLWQPNKKLLRLKKQAWLKIQVVMAVTLLPLKQDLLYWLSVKLCKSNAILVCVSATETEYIKD